jgi:hypothetical protein
MFWDRIALAFGYVMLAVAIYLQGQMLSHISDQAAKAQASLDRITAIADHIVKLH